MSGPGSARRALRRAAIEIERRWDTSRLGRHDREPPEKFRIVTYLGHGGPSRVVVRGRVLDNSDPGLAEEGEGTWVAVRRTADRFLTVELPGVPLRVTIGSTAAETSTDEEGYFDLLLDAGDTPFSAPVQVGEVGLASRYRGLEPPFSTPVRVRVPTEAAAYGVISDVDDTILLTGAQRLMAMVRQTMTGSALTRLAFPGSPELYRALAESGGEPDVNPFFYVSSSPWNLHDFLIHFLRHRGFPEGPLLLRDLLGSSPQRSHVTHKLGRIAEVLDLHPDLPFVLIGDSGQHDPEIYADVVRQHPGRILAVYIREVRLDPGDGRVEAVAETWDAHVPLVVAADSAAVARHAAELGLVTLETAEAIVAATSGG